MSPPGWLKGTCERLQELPTARSSTTATTVSAIAGHLFGFAAAAAVGTARWGGEAFGAEKLLFAFGEGELTVAIRTIEGRIGHRTTLPFQVIHLGQGSSAGGAKRTSVFATHSKNDNSR